MKIIEFDDDERIEPSRRVGTEKTSSAERSGMKIVEFGNGGEGESDEQSPKRVEVKDIKILEFGDDAHPRHESSKASKSTSKVEPSSIKIVEFGEEKESRSERSVGARNIKIIESDL